MKKPVAILAVLAILLTLLPRCTNTPQRQLKKMGYEMSPQAFLQSVEKGDASAVSLFLESKMPPDTRSEEGLTALMIAADAGHVEVIKALVKGKADIDATSSKDGFTALHLAASQGDLETCRLLIDAGASLGLSSNDGTTPLMIAVKSSYDVVELFLERGAPVNSQNQLGETALMMTTRNDYYELAQLLIDNGADLNLESLQGRTALDYCAPDSSVGQLLSVLGAQWGPKRQQLDALRHAAKSGNVEKARWYIQQGVDPNTPLYYNSVLSLAIDNLDRAMILMLLEEGASVEGDAHVSVTPLMSAVAINNTEVAALLLDRGADVNRTTSYGAAMNVAHQVDMAEFLINRGASIESKDDDGYTPLMKACSKGQIDMVRFLVSKGANVNAQATLLFSSSPLAVSPLVLAERNGHTEVADMLRTAGAK